MLYSILIFGSESQVAAWTPQEEKEVLGRHTQLRQELIAACRLGPVFRLQPVAARRVRKVRQKVLITDGPFAETKEQLMGIYVVECETFDDAVAAAERLSFENSMFEIQPVTWLHPGVVPPLMPT